ncbi:HalOD1 output domain-containing protein [Halobellus rufus]|uniref:HalOD1 output domain-containing protein n=1 Tax=Halobellus rufus TaxID=1448860 RepID=UPI000679A7AF|nr:HalOD1 output domain-containing protein [Halobellus rufus]
MTDPSDPRSFDDGDVDGGALGDSGTSVYTRDPDESPSTSVIRAVSEHTDTDEAALPPLYDAIDTDAIDDLLGDSSGSRRSGHVCITFRFAGCDVAVYADGRTLVSEPTSPSP